MAQKVTRPAWVRLVRKPLSVAEARAYQGLEGGRIRSPLDVVALIGPTAAVEEQEVFYVLVLDSQSRIRQLVEVSRGTMNSTLVQPREVFRVAIAYGGVGIIVVHNHPSGNPSPSPEDQSVTRGLVAAGALLEIPVYDHIILAGEQFFSFAEAGLM